MIGPFGRFLALTFLLVGVSQLCAFAPQGDMPAESRIHPAVHRDLERAGDGVVKAWVLFDRTDKGLASARAYEAALNDVASQYHPRAIQRRQLRRSLPGLFDVHDLPVPQTYLDQVSETGAELRVVSKWLNGVSVLADRAQLESIDQLPFVRLVQPVRRGGKPTPVDSNEGRSEAGSPSRAADQRQWYGNSEEQLTQINLIALHTAGYTGSGVYVGILDTGFQRSHEAFNETAAPAHPVTVVAEWDFVDGDPITSIEDGDPGWQHSHGTKVLGVMGAYKPDVLVGGAYDASFILAKTEDTTDEYPAEEDNFVAGLEFIEANGADLATSSLCYLDWYTQEDLDGMTAVTTVAVNIATANGVHMCNAAGNEWHDSDPGTSNLMAPADALEVITCGAVNSEGTIAYFSSDGPTADGRVKPEVLARGVGTSTVSSSSDTDYAVADGTSFATPLVACAVACLVQAHPDWTVGQMRSYLMHTAGDYVANGAYDPTYVRGYGIIDAAAASAGDCNGNGVGDALDITGDTSEDCNDNMVPDECEIALGQSADDDEDGVPDECQGQGIPTVSDWGIAAMVLLVLAAGTVVFRERHANRLPCRT